jgi:hypothetical protein
MEVQYDNTKITFEDFKKEDLYVVYFDKVKRVYVDKQKHALCFELLGERKPLCIVMPDDMCPHNEWDEAVKAIDRHATPLYDVVYALKKTRKTNRDALESFQSHLGSLDHVSDGLSAVDGSLATVSDRLMGVSDCILTAANNKRRKY